MKFGTPPPQNVNIGNDTGGGGCVKKRNILSSDNLFYVHITPTCGKVGDF